MNEKVNPRNVMRQFEQSRKLILNLKMKLTFIFILVAHLAIGQISGKITDTDGIPLPGASIIEKGTNNGVITDYEGNYTITVSNDDAILEFSFLGFETQEIRVGTKKVINVVLKESSQKLNEIVVVGYGKTERDKIGSSIVQINADEIENRSNGIVGIEKALGGQLKGVQITQGSGATGSESSINIRGITSPFGGSRNQPLIVIDNVPFFTDPNIENKSNFNETDNPLLAVDPDNIETLTVLKDAAATAIYGSRGANGVIIITTKRGRKNEKTRINIKLSTSVSNPAKLHDVLDADGYKQLHTLIANNTFDAHANGHTHLNGYNTAISIMDPDTRELVDTMYDGLWNEDIPVFGSANTNWQDEIYRKDALATRANIDISGGSQKTNYSASVSMTDQNGLMINSEFKQYGAKLALDSDLLNWLKTGVTLNYSGSKNNEGRSVSAGESATNESVLTRPDYPIYDEVGSFKRIPTYPNLYSNPSPGYIQYYYRDPNPVALLEKNYNRNSNKFIGNAYAEVKLLEELTVKANISVGIFDTDNYQFTPKRAKYKLTEIYRSPTKNEILDGFMSNKSYSTNFSINYNKSFGMHNLNAMLTYEINRDYYDNVSYEFLNTPDDWTLINNASALEFDGVRGGKNESGINSFLSRIQYDYDNRYTATINFRSDKSSKFGPGNKVGYFPSFALNWNIHNEKFMENVDPVDRLKLRASYGITGSSNVPDFKYLQLFEIGTRSDGVYGGEGAIIPSTDFPNVNIAWEKTTERNIGLDFGLFSNRLYGSVDVYHKYTDGILVNTPIFLESGAERFISNLAEISNKGIEFEIGGDIIRKEDMDWSVSFNYAKNTGIVEEIDNANLNKTLTRMYREGNKIGDIMGYKVLGIFQTQDEVDAANALNPDEYYYHLYTGPGDFKYLDENKDGYIDKDGDYVNIGNSQPDFFGGFSTSFRYKNFTLFGAFQYAVGVDRLYELNRDLLYENRDFNNMSPETLNSWTPTNTDTNIPRLDYYYYGNSAFSDAFLYDASFLKLKAVTLNYKLPTTLNGSVRSIDLFIGGTNLLTITDYPGLDPESISAYDINGLSRDYSTYPFSRTFTFGVKIGL